MLNRFFLSVLAVMLCGAVACAQPQSPYSMFTANAETPEYGAYWLGIWCSPVPPSLRAQLDLPEKQGVLVENVAPDSPAATAGIRQYDILLRAAEMPLAEPRDLVKAVEAAKEGKLKIELMRGGKSKTLEAVPAKRPEEARRQSGDWDIMERWMRGLGPDSTPYGQQPPMRFRFVHPGAIVPRDAPAPSPLPPDVSVIVSKEGDQPAKIVVKRGKEKWEVTEKELDKLPADIRPDVEQMLGLRLKGIVSGPVTVPNGTNLFNIPIPAQQIYGTELMDRMERRFDEINRRMDRLAAEVEKLGAGHARHGESSEKPTDK